MKKNKKIESEATVLNPVHKWVSWRISVIYWQLLRRSKIFNYWYKNFLNELLFDIQLCDIEREVIQDKYYKKLQRAS